MKTPPSTAKNTEIFEKRLDKGLNETKMSKIFLQRRYTINQQGYEKMLNIIRHERNSVQNHEILLPIY